MFMMSKRIWYECPPKPSDCQEELDRWGTNESEAELQKKMGPYDLVGYRESRARDNTSIEMPVYLNSKIVNGCAFMITKCRNSEESEKGMSRKARRQWAGSVSI